MVTPEHAGYSAARFLAESYEAIYDAEGNVRPDAVTVVDGTKVVIMLHDTVDTVGGGAEEMAESVARHVRQTILRILEPELRRECDGG